LKTTRGMTITKRNMNKKNSRNKNNIQNYEYNNRNNSNNYKNNRTTVPIKIIGITMTGIRITIDI
jgi:hypothetical protein